MFYSLLLQCTFYFKLKIWKTMIIDSLQISAPSPSKVALLYPPFDPGTNFGIILQGYGNFNKELSLLPPPPHHQIGQIWQKRQ